MSIGFFSPTYRQARPRFLSAAERAGGRLSHFDNPKGGPTGEELGTDVAEFGYPDAPQVLFAMSATHGVEGFCGSACQLGLLESGFVETLPDHVRLVVVHAINPYGFAWVRRVTEENVDLNRNFIDHDKGDYPVNTGYEELHKAICPLEWTEESIRNGNAILLEYGKNHGEAALQSAASAGQYSHSDGVYFGGNEKTWARKTFEKILDDTLRSSERAVMIDFHTGLGDYGYGELISEEEIDSTAYKWARDWFGSSVKTTASGESVSAHLCGTLDRAFMELAGDREALCLALEFGTVSPRDVFMATRADNWLHLHGDVDSDQGRRIKQDIRDAFFQDKDDWKTMIWERGLEVMSQARDGLANR